MIFDAKQFLEAYRIDHREYGANWQKGWVQIICPLCDDTNYHGGFNLSGGYYNCWKCGFHSNVVIISKLLMIGYKETRKIESNFSNILEFGGKTKKQPQAKICELPPEALEMTDRHKLYLESRNFNPDELYAKWTLLGTGPIGPYKFRIIAPIFIGKRLVSYQGRDITDKQDQRYKACKMEDEVIHHKHTLYGVDHIQNRSCVVVEGITDVWRLGFGAVATFGTEYTHEQVLLLENHCDCVNILFDPGAGEQADKLEADLLAIGVPRVRNFFLIDSDPADMPQEEADAFMKEYL